MWWRRTTEELDDNVVSFRRVGGIRPVGPDGTIRAYTTRDLRGHLAGIAVRLSAARKAAVITPIVVALAGWFVIPSYAAAPRPAPHIATHRAAAPVQAPPQQPVVSGPISVIPPANAPKTGAGDGIMRSSLVGFCLLLAGLVFLTAPRRNPHAEAMWRETHSGGHPDDHDHGRDG